MSNIIIDKVNDFPVATYQVRVRDETDSYHRVTIDEDYYKKLTNGKISPEKLIEISFQFLLSREPNTSILSEFNLKTISGYFTEYEDEIKTS